MYWKLLNNGGRREGVRESKGRGWNVQSKVHSQQGYKEKLLWILTLELVMKDSIEK
jgi:hypothetical protein